MYKDNRIVMTLDAGGTNFVFSAIQGCREIVPPLVLPSDADCLEKCLDNIVRGFTEVKNRLPELPVAISFAFPGPADYPAGIIGDLLNIPSFRGGIPLGPMLEEEFKIPVFINNDGNLFAYGEALAGVLPEINKQLEEAGSHKRYKNLLGLTLGTGFGAGVVLDGRLLIGDNAAGGDIWCFRNRKYPDCIVEDSVSIRAVQRVYAELSGTDLDLTPRDIFQIAEGHKSGDRNAAIAAFAELGEVAGNAIADAITLVDGVVVIGGGIAGASKYIMPSLLKELNGTIATMSGEQLPRLQMRVYNLDDGDDFKRFSEGEVVQVSLPRTARAFNYDSAKRIGVTVSRMGTSRAIAVGAYCYALNQLR